MMQVIAGVHFNYSLPEAFWPVYQQLEGDKGPLRDFIDRNYFALIRNLQRFGWVIPYLFGASPAVCDSFLTNRDTHLEILHCGTRYEPWATSLRMGDIGYTNRQEACAGMKACYDDLGCYVASLSRAISTPCKYWQEIGVPDPDGGYRQLNANLLQIENEYYSTVRPKQIQQAMEKPVHALHDRGVRYVELRSLDIDPFDPLGISLETMRFIEGFMIFCLLAESPPIDPKERRYIDRNLEDTAHNGRACDFQLARLQGPIRLGDWLDEILERMEEICKLLDQYGPEKGYAAAFNQIRTDRTQPEQTPSARIIGELKGRGHDFFNYTYRQAEQHRAWFLDQPLSSERRAFFEEQAARSIAAQREMEQAEQLPLEEFLLSYFSA
jgi:glutamate--cysteine ligase